MGWRRAFCTGPPKSSDDHADDSNGRIFKSADPPTPVLSSSRSPRLVGKLNFFTSSSNPVTPRLRCRTSSSTENHISETESSTTPKIDKPPSKSPKSPLKLPLFRNSVRSHSGCGVCGQSVKSGRGTAVYTAQCGHVYHFPCIATHVRGTSGKKLACLVCNAEWNDEPLLAVHQNLPPQFQWNKHNVEFQEKKVISAPQPPSPTSSASSPRPQFHHYQARPVQIKCYDDDEPLSSPRAATTAFNPIPESDEEGEEPRMATRVSTERNRRVEIRLMPESALISTTGDHQTCAMVLKVKSPQLPARSTRRTPLLDPSRRAPIDLVTVLDVSGSMMGGKMQMMRRAMRLMISSLGPQDRLSIVAFSAVPKRLFPFRRMTQSGQRAARAIVDRLECSQGSCVSDALRKASKVLEDRRERNPVATIILLSDCQDDSPESQRPAPQPQSHRRSTTRFAHVEIPLNSPSDDTFAKWVGGLLSVVIQDLKIELGFAHGSYPAEITAVYDSDRQTSLLRSSTVALGDLYAEEERELLVELQVPNAAVRLGKVLTVKCSYKDPATHERITTKQETFIIPIASSSPGIQRLRNVFISTRAIAESRRIMEHGEFASAHRLLSSARALLMQSASMSGEECVHVLEAEIMELARRRQEQQMVEQERIMASIRQQRIGSEASTPPSSAGKKTSWNRVSDLHGFENARF